MPVFGIESPGLLQTIFDNVDAALVVLDKDGRVVFTNLAFATVFGENREELPTNLADWLRSFLERGYRFQDNQGRDTAIDGSNLMRALVGEEVEPRDFRMIFPNGGWKWIHASVHRFSVVGLTGVLVIATDETAPVELRNTAARAERLETFGTISRALAHDFNNILDIISSNAHLALTDTHDPETTRVHLQAISTASQEAAELVRRLTKFGRTPTVATRAVQINDSVADVLQLVHPLIRDGIRVKTDLSPGLPMIEADPVEMDQVLVNVIVNALDAMPQGGDLIISTGVVEIDETKPKNDPASGRLVSISISDTGIGMPAAVQSRVFELFFTTKQEGTGLGMWNAFRIVRQHGGDIKVKSEPGTGTNFTISLPAS
jgi:signal transduction histidine kinase